MPEQLKPMDIEARSFEIITELLGDRKLDPENALVIKRAIHTTADFDYADNLVFSPHAVQKGIEALKAGLRYRHRHADGARRHQQNGAGTASAARSTASCRMRTLRRRRSGAA